MSLTISIDHNSISLIVDGAQRRSLGTGFSFIQPNWVVTAKHVVLDQGLPRQKILVSPYKHVTVEARLLYAHPLVDLAVLELPSDICNRPLFPAHHSLAGSSGLICAGYAPSKTNPVGPAVFFINEIPSFESELRERTGLNEELIVFDAAFSEGGHSGGPIFGSGGGVVGAIIENFASGGSLRARGTSLAPLVRQLCFPRGDG
jgi:hypothetical protein